MKEEVILIFDIGKTNKKVILFDRYLKVLHEEETRFDEIVDDEGFPCDDAAQLESWVEKAIMNHSRSEKYTLKGVNFATYGASLVYLDEEGSRITPIYNYLKPLSGHWLDDFYKCHGGVDEFSRLTASPALGMLNSGLQLLCLKRDRPELFNRVRHILHLPNYFSYLVTGQINSEHTSIGCHTAMWNFDSMEYHQWLEEEGVLLPKPVPVSETRIIKVGDATFEAGVGIHDSSSSLAPYILAAGEPFVLISTGTWCITMNPFNPDPLTDAELKQDCLSYIAVNGKAVKSSRFFLGHKHDVNVERIEDYFGEERGSYKKVQPLEGELKNLWNRSGEQGYFFTQGIQADSLDILSDLSIFSSFGKAYARFMCDLTFQAVESVKLVMPENSPVKRLYITGGFAKNPFFTGFLSLAFPEHSVFTSEVANATSLGAALVIAGKVWPDYQPFRDLGLTGVFI